MSRLPDRSLFVAALLGVPLSQVGHVAAYLARYGQAGMLLQQEGVHAYFPDLLHLGIALLGAGVLGGLLLLAAGRLALGRALDLRREGGVALGPLFCVAAVVQMDVYLAQETSEALLGGQPLRWDFLLSTLAWGAAGQLPLALLAALALRWLSIRLRAAVAALRMLPASCLPCALPEEEALRRAPAWLRAAPAPWEACGLVERAPPHLLLTR